MPSKNSKRKGVIWKSHGLLSNGEYGVKYRVRTDVGTVILKEESVNMTEIATVATVLTERELLLKSITAEDDIHNLYVTYKTSMWYLYNESCKLLRAEEVPDAPPYTSVLSRHHMRYAMENEELALYLNNMSNRWLERLTDGWFKQGFMDFSIRKMFCYKRSLYESECLMLGVEYDKNEDPVPKD